MNLGYYISISLLLIFAPLVQALDNDSTPKNKLSKYLSTAERKEAERAEYEKNELIYWCGTMSPLLSNPALYPLIPTFSTLYMTEHENLRHKAPVGFRESLEKLATMIDQQNSVFIGGKEYMLAKQFNDLENTGYIIWQGNPKIMIQAPSHPHKQYEIYIMPDHQNLVATFEKITDALAKRRKDIAFIAIRPTPQPYNSMNQTLPRIIIVLKKDVSKEAAEKIMRTAYHAVKDIPNLKASGLHPRFSQAITFGNAVEMKVKPLKSQALLPNIFFVGIGNSDFKAAHPDACERKKWLGFAQRDDRAYLLGTPETEKFGVIIIGK